MMGLQAAASKRKLDEDITSPHASPQPAKHGRLEDAAHEATAGVTPNLGQDWRSQSSLSVTTLHHKCSEPTKTRHEICVVKSVDEWRHNSSILATTLQDDEESDEDDEDDDEEEERGGKYLPAGRGYQCVRFHSDHYSQEHKQVGYYGTNGDQGGYSGGTPPPQYSRQQPHYPPQRSAQYWGGGDYCNQEPMPQQTIRCEENGKSYLDLGSSRAFGADVKCCDGRRTSWCSRGPGATCYRQRRLAVLNISMCKLGRYRQFPDPSLHRSVLICNTLRYIEREMEHEGFFFNNSTGTVQAPPPPAPPPHLTHPIEPDQGYHGGQFSDGSSYPANNYRGQDVAPLPSYEQNLRDLSSSGRATPFPQTMYDGDSGVGDEESTRGINWGSVLSLTSQSDLDPMNNNDLYPASPTGSLTLGLDATSLDMDVGHEFENFIPGWKLTPLSADDIIKSVPTSELSTRQSEGELDSIMHVLVGT